MDGRHLRIGELAELTGLTIRALHHYDEIGLLVPGRTEAGHRIYADGEVGRLYRIVALQGLGLSLDEIGRALDDPATDLRMVAGRQLELLDRSISEQERLRARLVALVEALDREVAPTTEDLIDLIERTTMIEQYYTKEQLVQLEARRQELGDDAIRQAERAWAELIAAVEAERADGSDPAGARMQQLATRWLELIEAFTGGDPGIAASLRAMYTEQGPQRASRGMVDQGLFDYMGQAIAARSSS